MWTQPLAHGVFKALNRAPTTTDRECGELLGFAERLRHR